MLWQFLCSQFAGAILFSFPHVHALQGSSPADDIIAGLDVRDCASCHTLLLNLRVTATLGDNALSNTLKSLCKQLKLQDPDVCEGIFDSVGPLVAHDLRSMSPFGQTSTKFCNAMLGLCDEPPVNEYTVPFPKPAPANPKEFKSSGRPPFQVTHFSDVHIDHDYSVGSEANCSKPLCCRVFADQSNTTKLPAGPLGNHLCDTPNTLADSIVKAIDDMNSSFSLFTGDIVDGAVWLVNQEDVTADINLFSEEFRMGLSAPVFPALGNHESAPVNSFPRNTTEDHANDASWVFETSSAQWSPWIGQSAADQAIHHSGSYSVVVANTNLRIISLNSGFWYKMNLWLYDSNNQQPDPNSILSFLVSELQIAEDLGQRVWIMAHMASGGGDAFHESSNYYDQIIQRYKHVIAASFYGHTHSDEFQLAYSDYSNRTKDTVTGMAWLAPALTPRSGNPAFKVYDVDPDTYEIMDAKVYSTNVSHPEYQIEPVWSLLYSARDLYGPLIPGGLSPSDPLSPSFWHQVTEVFESSDEVFEVFQSLKRRTGRGGCRHRKNDDEAFDKCKNHTICQLRAQRSENNCVVVSRDVKWLWDPETSGDSELTVDHECEGVGAGAVLRQMVDVVSSGKLDESTKNILRAQLDEILLPAQNRHPISQFEPASTVASDSGDTQKFMQIPVMYHG
ncbi:sphingomyelin phosphodiesterase [Gymnopus androsaceus JB14]|uniref:Sphingomyelin phosphodiesterase n=1 Tax=Gymnopus androsaceus JB14 TaxID=1447944 RepID=A0A6A4IFA1_9AGAR|nr:sphingomyelin phosphodiesterase [Gymnopus androsaceus JB14]